MPGPSAKQPGIGGVDVGNRFRRSQLTKEAPLRFDSGFDRASETGQVAGGYHAALLDVDRSLQYLPNPLALRGCRTGTLAKKQLKHDQEQHHPGMVDSPD